MRLEEQHNHDASRKPKVASNLGHPAVFDISIDALWLPKMGCLLTRNVSACLGDHFMNRLAEFFLQSLATGND